MKRCNACDEEFEGKFSYCQVDSSPLNKVDSRLSETPHCARDELQLTILDSTVLPGRLTKELRFLISQMRQSWPIIKGDPVGSSRRAATAVTLHFNKLLAEPNSMAAIATALAILRGAILIVFYAGVSNAFGVVQPKNHDDKVGSQMPGLLRR